MASVQASPTAAAFRDRCCTSWQVLVNHPFVEALAGGKLPLDRFCRYLEQDVHFLQDFARAIGRAIGRSADEEELRQLAARLAIIVGKELDGVHELLDRVRALLGERAPAPAPPAPTTVAYGRFLIATAARGDALDLLTAMLPCAWSYAEIGRRWAASAAEHPVYADWLRLFGGDEYLAYIEEQLAIFERFAARAHPVDDERLFGLFAAAMRFERAFWDMAYGWEEQ